MLKLTFRISKFHAYLSSPQLTSYTKGVGRGNSYGFKVSIYMRGIVVITYKSLVTLEGSTGQF